MRLSAAATPRLFVSLYGGVANGCGHLRRRGWYCACIDNAFSPANDLNSRFVRQDVDLILPYASAVGVDQPCNTWSTARRAPLWSSFPHRLRNREHLWGLPGLERRDLWHCKIGNSQARYSAKVIRYLVLHGIPGYLENPLASLLWAAFDQLLVDLISQGLITFVVADLCQHNRPYKKSTNLMLRGPNRGKVSMKTCSGCDGRRDLCSRTCLPHVKLEGIAHGEFRTRLAQEYPYEFISHLLSQLV